MNMCKCIEETEPQFREKIEGDLSSIKPRKDAVLESFSPENYGLLLRTGKHRLSIAFTAHWKLANGKTKDTTVNMIASHCPFCGLEFEPEQPIL